MKQRTPKHGLTFNEGNHTYRLDGQWVPSVTGILGCLDKPAIPKWAAGVVAEYVADNADELEQLRKLGRKVMVGALKDKPWEKRDTAGQRGTNLHDILERLLRDPNAEVEVEDEYVPVIENAITFLEEWEIEPVLTEVAVGSRPYQYAGKLDMIAQYRRPDTGHEGTAIFDWKSGKALYPEYAWQLAAYAHAEFYGEGGDEHELPTVDASFGIQIRADGYDVAPFKFGPDVYDEFLAIRNVAAIVKRSRGNWKVPGSGHVGVMIQRENAA
jgi:hypothetical protein